MRAFLAVVLLAAINLAADAQYYYPATYGDGYYSPYVAEPQYVAEYVWPWEGPGDMVAEPISPYPMAPVYDDIPFFDYRQPRGKKGKKGKKGGGGWGWPEPVIKTVGWGWNKEQHIILPGPHFHDEHAPTIHIHQKPIHHHGWGWGGKGGGGGGYGGGGGGYGGGGGGYGGGGGGYGGGGGGGGHGGWGWGHQGLQIHHHGGWGWGHGGGGGGGGGGY